MKPALAMAALWMLFGGLHVGLGTRRIRALLVRRLGERGFALAFSFVAAVSFTLLVVYYAAHRTEGAAGLALGRVEWVRWALMTASAAGIMLASSTFAHYPRSPYAVLGRSAAAARGMARITRHPFFAGLALFAIAHGLLATRLIGTVFLFGFALLALAGAAHQDRKLVARRGEAHAAYLRETSMLPFAAIVSRRQRLLWRELPLGALAIGAALALGLRQAHEFIFSAGGFFVVAAVLGGAAFEIVRALRRHDAGTPGAAAASSRLERLTPLFLFATGVGHVLVGLALFHEPLAAIWRDGIVNSIGAQLVPGAQSWLAPVRPRFEREAAFWFLLFGPCLWMLGQITRRAVERPDPGLLRIVAWNLLGMGVLGALIMPVSGFWILIALAPLVLRVATRLDAEPAHG
jgi:uncharacterized membrane protein